MRYIYSMPGAIIAFILFIAIVIFIPGYGPNDEVTLILTISTFLFAILAGFFISRLNSRYDKIRELISDEDALFLSFYKTSQVYGDNFAKKIAECIDNFYIVAFDFIIGNCYKETSEYFLKMWDEVIKIKKVKNSSSNEYLFEQLTEIEKARNQAAALYNEKMSYGQWVILLALSGIILFSIFYIKTSVLYSQIISVLLSTVLVLVLLLIRDLQNFMLGGGALLEESGQEVLMMIGKKRYYNNYYLNKGMHKIPKTAKEYRVGMHEPGDSKFKIKLVKR
ncbi:MAG: hypothetical protein ABIH72_04205 [archaeon]